MELNVNIFTRRSVRKYTGEPVSTGDIETIIKAGMYAPSARNGQPWQFIVIDDRSLLEQIAAMHRNAQMVKDASLALVVCGDPALTSRPVYLQLDLGAAIENVLLAAHGLGLGAVWCGVYPDEARTSGLKALLGIPAEVQPMALIPLGYPAETPEEPERFKPERIHHNTW